MDSEHLHDPVERIAKLEQALVSATEQVAALRHELGGEEVQGERIDWAACLTALDIMGLLGTAGEADDLLETIVEVATHAVNAEAGSLLLVAEDQEHLVFEAVHGEKADELKKFRLKLGQGIAGFVAASGQPLCVTDVEQSEQWDKSISEAIQFRTQSILAVPALAGERTVGVLEVVNKVGGGPFEQQDIRLLSQFAKIAGAAVERRSVAALTSSLLAALKRQAGDAASAEPDPSARASLLKALEEVRVSGAHEQALRLSIEVEALCSKGPHAADLCLQILAAANACLSKRQGTFNFGCSPGDLTW